MKYPLNDAYTLSVQQLIASVETDTAAGLSQPEATKRNKQYGPNHLKNSRQESMWFMLLRQFKSPIVYLLAFGALISFLFSDVLDAVAILSVILINALIGFFMELQARSSMNALQKMDLVYTNVIRDGKVMKILSEELTPGDMVPLEAGDVVPADGRLIEVNRLQCDESSLTGESMPLDKNTAELALDTATGDQHNMVFKGTAVINGTGKFVITGIAEQTQLGIITSLVDTAKSTVTPLDIKLSGLSSKLIWVMLAMTVVFATTGIIQGKSVLLIIETSIALAVAAIPEGLPVVATIALSYGLLLMGKRNVIVKKLSAVETLGSTGVILTDKTGTLTENKIYADTFAFPGESVSAHIENEVLTFPKGETETSKENFEKLLLAGILCNNAITTSTEKKDSRQTPTGDPIDVALLQIGAAAGFNREELIKQYERVAETPFSSDIMMMATLHKTSSGYFAAAKGSVEHLLEKCSHLQNGVEIKPLDNESRDAIKLKSEQMATNGLRVLAFACRSDEALTDKNYLSDMIYIGSAGFLDPPRLDIKDAIVSCKNAGMKVVMITGDHPHTALNIARQVGLIDDTDNAVITGKELAAADPLAANWSKRLMDTSVFARITPKQKLDITAMYQQAGNIVAMTGDGVNDAPALKKADVGIAMGIRGTQVAKETAAIILKDDSFTSIARAVAHGREIFQNIQKFAVYLVSCNLSEIFIVTLLGIIAPAATLLPLQILFLNMVTDIFPALALGLGTGDKTVMHHPPRHPEKPIITNKTWYTIALYAALMSMAVTIAVIYCKYSGMDDRATNSVAFVTLTFAQLFHVFNMSSPRSGLLINEVTRNKFVWLALLLCVIIVGLVFSFPAMRLVLGLTVLSVNIWLIALAASCLPLVILKVYKWMKHGGTAKAV
jgi:P-type Ca2+ transporter type 2C